MNEKKDDSEGRSNNLTDTAELLESLFRDTKDSRIKLVRRKPRPKSGMRKRVVSKQRKESVKKTSKTRVLMQGRPSEPEKSTGATKEKTQFRKASLPGSMISKGSKIKPTSVQRAAADTKPTSTIRKDDGEKISKTDVLKKKRGPSMTSAGATEDKAAIAETAEIVFDSVDQKRDASADHEGLAEVDEEITKVLGKSAISSMISSLEARGEEAQQIQSPKERPISEDEEGDTEIFFDSVDQKRDASADHEGLAGADEEITEVLGKSAISSMISSLEARGEEAQQTQSPEERPISKDEEGDTEIFFDGVDQKRDASADHEGLAEVDEEITKVLGKSAIGSMISSLEARGEEAQQTQSPKERPISEDEEGDTEIFFDGVDQKGDASKDHEGLAGADEEITEVLDKSAISSMISSLEASGEEAQRIPSAEEGSIPEDEKEDVETVVEAGAPEKRPSVFSKIGGLGKEEPLTQENRAASGLIGIEDSLLKVGEHEAYSESRPEEKPISEDKKQGVETVVEAGAPEERPLVFSRIGGLGKEEPLAQENRAASSSTESKDSLLKVGEHEAYSESRPEEKSISEDKEEGEDSLIVTNEEELLHEQAAEEEAVTEGETDGVDETLKEERPSDPAVIVGAAEEEPLFHEEPAASSSIGIEDSLLEESEHEAYLESAFEEGPISEDKEDGYEEIQEAVGPEKEPPLAPVSAEPTKEKRQFQEQPASTLGPLDDSLAGTGEQDFHHRQAAEDEPMLTDRGGDIQKASRLEKSREDKRADLEGRIEQLMEEIQSLRSSVRRAMLVKVVLPLVLFAILAVILSIWLMPFDSSEREEPQEMAKEETVETYLPGKQDAPSDTSKDIIAVVEEEVRPSTSEPPAIPAKEEMAKTPEPKERDIASETSKKIAAVAEQDVEHSDAAGKAEAVQKEKPVSNTFSIYLGPYGTLKEAEKAVAEYKRNNVLPYLSEVYVGDKVEFYRVFTGLFKEKAQAEEYIKRKGLMGAKVWKIE